MLPNVRNRAVIDNKHAIRDPFMNKDPVNTTIWANTLLKTRIPDLFKTKIGLIGHANQIQGELNRIGKVNELDGIAVSHAINVLKSVRNATKASIEAAQERKAELGLPAEISLQFPLLNDQVHF